MKVLKKVPKSIGKGEGGATIAKLHEIFEEIDEKLDSMEGGDIDTDDFVKKGELDAYAKQSDVDDLESRVDDLEDDEQ